MSMLLQNVEINDELQPVVVNSMKIDLAMPMPIPAPLLEPKSVSVFDGSLQGEWEFEGTSGVSVSVSARCHPPLSRWSSHDTRGPW
eukprot:scaffold3611_cov364-Prasinococcus_capsulatus_cf.AAC.6